MQFWYLTSTTYGTWLPGDPRGSVSNTREWSGPRSHDNVVGEPPTPHSPGLHDASQQRLKFAPVFFTVAYAEAVIAQFLETARYRGWRVHAVAVMRNHFHMLVEVLHDPNPGKIPGDFKGHATRTLNSTFGHREEWWTDRGSKRPNPTERSRYAAVRYTRDQEGVLASYFDPESIYVARLELYEREHGLLSDEPI